MSTNANTKPDFLDTYKDIFEIKGLKVFQKTKKWIIDVELKKLMGLNEIKHIENSISSAYRLSDVKLNIVESFLKDKGSNLCVEHLQEVKSIVLKENPSFIGFFKESEINIKGTATVITAPNKAVADFLTVRKCDALFEKYIFNYFNINSRVSIQYKDEDVKGENYQQCYFSEESKIICDVMKNPGGSKDKGGAKGDSEKSGGLKDNIIMGKYISETPMKISDVTEESGRIVIEGHIFNIEQKTFNNGKTLVTFFISDNTFSITIKLFLKDEAKDKIIEALADGKHLKLKGDVQFDTYSKELVVYPTNMMEIQVEKRKDTAPEKRVELHCHTGMSSMDGTSSAKDLIKRAKAWDHKAIAITDHGVVQAFPEAYETAKKLGIKVIYGVEGYFVNDGVPIVYNPKGQTLDDEFVVFDIETTGLSAHKDKITEIGAVKVKNGQIVDSFSSLINPEIDIPEFITKLTGITNAMVADEKTISEVLPMFLEFAGNTTLVAHNALFDWGFIKAKAQELELSFDNTVLDTLQLSRALLPKLKKHKLNIICEHLGIQLLNHHRAKDDAEATAKMFMKFCEMMKAQEVRCLDEINDKVASQNINFKKADSYHIIILVKNETGLKNLYKLISISHLEYYHKRPRILKSILLQYREGLIIGSACEAGEIYRGLLNGVDESVVMDNAKFYDYLEIQPNGNNEFLLRNGKLQSAEDLKNINRKIIEIGSKLGKPVVATGDVHFLEPEDEVYRRILMAGQGFSDADEQAPLYFKTTNEMLEEFAYLGKEKAREVVIVNPNKIIEEIDDIKPIPDETFPPIIEGSDVQITEMTMKKAHAIYGEVLPDIVEKRLEKELNSIIKHGFSVMYLIAQKLVTKSLSDGYLVGSRGSVGSSFVATMSDITEVNPLPPHYVCPNCKKSEFFADGSIGSGADLPDKMCPDCSTEYKKDGFDIPFEVFLGFDGDKEPDIDLNFAGEYQPEAHKYTEELFGKGYVFRAGTIGTIADKTAYGFVKKYFDERSKTLNNAEAMRLVNGCTGVKRTTGQHPGGVMVVPSYTDIYKFTPIQRPADDPTSSIITTHFDYHSISGRLLKLDILGHDGPTIIRMLEDMTGFNVQSIRLDDPKTMSLFTSADALNINLEDIDCKVGSLGIPEFGTKFVRQMLMDTMPTTLAELIRIAGLSHGTDVWLNNAQELVRNGTAVLKDVISTRDDIMVYLIYKGLKPKSAFKIMENVRKGKGLTDEHIAEMREQNVPEWYIESCQKIKYMFPKAHAAAYVMMSFRIAYYKVYYPEAFYCTYYYVKIEDFDADLMVKGKEVVKARWKEIEKAGNNATTKEKNLMTLLEVVYEMYMRGIKVLPVDLYKSSPSKFLITEEGILPPLNALQGVGLNAAISIAKVREDSPFISMDDLRERAKVSKTVIEILKNHGSLKDLPESNQISLFNL